MNDDEMPASEKEDILSHLDHRPNNDVQNSTPGDGACPTGTIHWKQFENGLDVFEGSGSTGCSPGFVFSRIEKLHQVYWLVNAKQAGIGLGDGLEREFGDQFQGFPAEISNENSLHVFPGDTPDLPAIVTHSIQRDAAVCVASDLAYPDLVAAMKTSFGFFAKPSTLWFQLENASPFVQEQLFSACKFIVFQFQNDAWTIASNGIQRNSWQEIGLPFEPKKA